MSLFNQFSTRSVDENSRTEIRRPLVRSSSEAKEFLSLHFFSLSLSLFFFFTAVVLEFPTKNYITKCQHLQKRCFSQWCRNGGHAYYMVSKLSGSHFGSPPSSVHRMTGLGGNSMWTTTYCRQGCLCFGLCGPHQCSADTGADTWQKQALYHMPGWLTLTKASAATLPRRMRTGPIFKHGDYLERRNLHGLHLQFLILLLQERKPRYVLSEDALTTITEKYPK